MIGDPSDDGDLDLALLFRLGQAPFGAVGGGAPEASQTFERASACGAAA